MSPCVCVCISGTRQGQELSHNVSAGVIKSNQSLVLQQVSRESSGQYTCSAANLEGSEESTAVYLSVKCKRCVLISTSSIGLGCIC